MKAKRWSDAINIIKQSLKSGDHCYDDTTIKYLGKCLRYQGEYEEALTVLERGIKQFTNSVVIYIEMFNLFSALNQWDKARSIAEILINLEPEKGRHYFRLGRSYSYLKEPEPASYYYKQALEKQAQITIEEIIDLVKKDIKQDKGSLKSKYIFLGGKNNLGAIEHVELNQVNPKAYITKIVYMKKKREEIFYKNICECFPQLKNITPRILCIRRINNISFITMEKINGQEPEISNFKGTAESIIKNMASVRHSKQLLDCYNPPDHSLILNKKRSQTMTYFFADIHKLSTNHRLFMLLKKELGTSIYSPGSVILIERLESIVLLIKLYDKIQPERNYAFLHGDLGPHNVILERQTCKPYIVDWNSYTTGPAWFDLASLAARLKIPYQEIDQVLFSDFKKGLEGTAIDKVFFLFAYIVLSFQSLSRRKFDRALKSSFIPALDKLEALVLDIASPEERENYIKFKEKDKGIISYKMTKHFISWIVDLIYSKLKSAYRVFLKPN